MIKVKSSQMNMKNVKNTKSVECVRTYNDNTKFKN